MLFVFTYVEAFWNVDNLTFEILIFEVFGKILTLFPQL